MEDDPKPELIKTNEPELNTKNNEKYGLKKGLVFISFLILWAGCVYGIYHITIPLDLPEPACYNLYYETDEYYYNKTLTKNQYYDKLDTLAETNRTFDGVISFLKIC